MVADRALYPSRDRRRRDVSARRLRCEAGIIDARVGFADNRRMRFPLLATASALVLGLATPPAGALDVRGVHLDGAAYRVVELDLAHDRLELHWKDASGQPLASIDGLRRWGAMQDRTLLFAANAGIYDHAFRPLGLHVEDGATLRPLNTTRGNASRGNFAIQPNGIFHVDVDGNAGVVPTSEWRARGIEARLATQSGPMLVVEGEINPAFDAASRSLKLRSGVCARTPHEVVFAVSEAPVSFHAFARLFRDRIGCGDALYLDGTLSRLWTQAEGYAGAPAVVAKPYAGMFAVFAEPTPTP